MSSKKKVHLKARTNHIHSTIMLPPNQTKRQNGKTAERWSMSDRLCLNVGGIFLWGGGEKKSQYFPGMKTGDPK